MTFLPIEQAVAQLEAKKSRPKLCPVCNGTGEFDTPSNMGPRVPECPVCKGGGVVDLSLICACGMPAVIVKEGVVYCGRQQCLHAMRSLV